MQYSPTGESGMMGMFLVLSLGLHLVFFVLDQLNVFNLMPEFSDEWAIETELVADDGFIPHTSLPDARKKKEVKVSDKTLPQLPRSYKVRKEDKADEGLAKKPAEQDKTGTAEKASPDTVVPPKDTEATTELDKKDVLKRLALERLRKMKKKADRNEAKPDKMARIKSEMDKAKAQKMTALASQADGRRYAGLLRKQITRHYSLPQTFTSKVANPRVVVAIKVNSRGELTYIRIVESSTDPVFDEYTLKAARSAAPYTKPPGSLAGKSIHLAFTTP